MNDICPAGKIKCKKYEYIDNEAVQRDTHQSNHRCWALKRPYYVHHFEVCPFPSRQKTDNFKDAKQPDISK